MKEAGTNNIAVKKNNRRLIAELLFKRGGMSKPEIASRLKLSLPTVSTISKELIDDGLVKEMGTLASSGGRKPVELVPVYDARYSIGVKIESEKIRAIVIDLGVNIIYQKTMTLGFENTSNYWKTLISRLNDVVNESGIDRDKILGFGLAVPGVVSHRNQTLEIAPTLKASNISIANLIGGFDYNIKIENDANLMGIAELFGRDYVSDAVCLFINKGIGGAILVNNEVFMGQNFRAGEFGHMTVVKNGRECSCGKTGCFEAYCSLNVLTEDGKIDLDTFFAELKRGNTKYIIVWDEYLDHLSTAINNINNIFDTNIIIGGDIGSYLKVYMDDLNSRVQEKSCFEYNDNNIELSKYGYNSCAIGAALLFVESFLKS